jgi:cardiolipin synthase A/B
MELGMSWLVAYSIVGYMIRAAMVPVVLRRQFAPGAAVAWLGIVFLHPYIGLSLYMLVGESRLRPARAEAYRLIVSQFRSRPPEAGQPGTVFRREFPAIYEPMVLQAEKISGLSVYPGNTVEFITDSARMIERLAADIDAAKSQVHLLYYMFAPDATGERIVAALIRAAKRGVKCRVLVDALASRSFFLRDGLSARLQKAGVATAAALPVASLRRGLSRLDLRNHRKLSVIDDWLAYVGSQNLVDPSYGGRRGAPWVDVSGRLTGPVVSELAGVFCEDWVFETCEKLDRPDATVAQPGGDPAPMQVVPTGPNAAGETYRRLLLSAIQCARKEVIITTPYFVPDEPTLVALMMAADRGVNVKMILPLHSDSMFTAVAGRAHYATLMQAGVEIHLYRPGLLHSKTTTIDDAFAVFGSANVDVRSFHLNFELSVIMYGAAVTEKLRTIQQKYLADSNKLDAKEWRERPAIKRYADGAISLLSPLL